MTDPKSPEEHSAHLHDNVRVLDAGALRALAHPLRVQIYDILSQYGAQTASSLAGMLGESSGATSYHLRALATHDLIQEVEGKGTGRERWWERPRGGVTFANPEAMRTPSGRAATQVVMTEFFNRRHQQLMDFVAGGLQSDPKDWLEGTLLSTGTARATPEQLLEFTTEIAQLVDEFIDKYRDQQGEGVRPITIRTDIFPLPIEGKLS